MSSPGETKMSSPGETSNCFLITKASPGGGGLPHYVSSFWSRFFAPRGWVRPCSWSLPKAPHRGPVRHHVCPPSPLNEASISGPTASFCPLPPNQDQMVGVLGWKGCSRQQTQVSCRCLPMFVKHTSSNEIARCKSVRSGRVGTSRDPKALAVFYNLGRCPRQKVRTDRQRQAEGYRIS